MPWKFEDAAPVLGHITEGNCWDGEAMLFSNIHMSRIMRLDVDTGLLTVYRTGTEGTNGLNFDKDGNLYGCSGTGRKIVRFEKNGRMIGRSIRSASIGVISASWSSTASEPPVGVASTP